jgi:hypothetical protein
VLWPNIDGANYKIIQFLKKVFEKKYQEIRIDKKDSIKI